MADKKQTSSNDKAEWTEPKLVELDFDLDNVENGFNAGNDGAGGFTTSLS